MKNFAPKLRDVHNLWDLLCGNKVELIFIKEIYNLYIIQPVGTKLGKNKLYKEKIREKRSEKIYNYIIYIIRDDYVS